MIIMVLLQYFSTELDQEKPRNSCMHPTRFKVMEQSNLGFPLTSIRDLG